MSANSAFATFKFVGLAEIRHTLKTLPKELQDKVLKTAVERAAKPLVASAKQFAGRSKRTGALQESIGAFVKKGKKGGDVYAVVGPRRGYYKGGKALGKDADKRGADSPAHYAHLVEYGHVQVAPIKGTTLRKKKKNWKQARATGFVPPKPFMRPAMLASAGEVEAELAAGVAQGIDRQLKRLVKNPRAAR